MKKFILFTFLFLCSVSISNSNIHKKVLFIGNSLTAGMPEIVQKIAESKGDSLYYNHIGGAPSLIDSVDNYTRSIINSEDWDYVVVQYNHKIKEVNEVIKQNSECTQTIVYMMWGWENGNNSTLNYFEQQDKFRTTYINTSDEIKGICVPAGISWKEVRTKKPWINLYGGDNYHPNQKGKYLTACTFYSTLFEKSSEGATNYGLSDSTTNFFQQVAAYVVLDSLDTWNINRFVPNNAPNYTNPVPNSETESNIVTFEWQNDESIESYNLQVSTDKDFKNLIFTKMNLIENSYTHDLNVYNTQVYVRLRGNFTTSSSISCNTAWRYLEFKTPYGGPTLYTPEDSISCVDREVRFDWEHSMNTDSYIIQFAFDSIFSDIIYQDEIFQNSFIHRFYTSNNNIFWRVQVYTGAISKKWSEPRQLVLKDLGPNQLLPENNSLNIPNSSYDLSWNNSETGSEQKYNLQISNDNQFKDLVIDAEGLTNNTFEFISEQFAYRYFWRVQSFSNECPSAWSEIHNFKTKLKAPELLLPPDKSQLKNPDIITLEWDSRSKLASYQLLISTDSNFTEIAYTEDNIQGSQIEIQELIPLTTYYWKVNATIGNEIGETSKIWTFTTSAARPNSPILFSPKDVAINQDINIDFKWQAVNGANSYIFEVAENEQFTVAVDKKLNLKTNEIRISNLNNNQTYFWRVKSIKDDIESNWSDVWTLKTITTKIEDKVKLTSPINQDTISYSLVNCTWEILPEAELYRIQISENIEFEESKIVFNETAVNNSQTIDNLVIDAKYYWKVRGENIAGAGKWSDIFSFITKDAISSIELINNISKIYPNPSYEGFNIESEFSFDKIIIRNIEGVFIDSLDIDITNEYHLKLSERLAKGIYYIELRNGKESVINKLIIK